MCKIIIFFFLFILTSCVDTPTPEQGGGFVAGSDGAIILCEGLHNTDKSSLTRIDFSTSDISNNYFALCNPNLILGDIACDMVLLDSICLISVSGTGCIYKVSMNNGKVIDKLLFPKFVMPRKICVINDTLAFVTAYIELSNSDFFVYYFNPNDMQRSQLLLNEHCIQVGSHPEGIAVNGDYLFVANSGYGDFQYTNPTAATISVVDINAKQEITKFKTGDNPNRLYTHNGKLYVACWGLPSDTNINSSQLIEYDAITFSKIRSWNTACYDMCFYNDTLFYLNSTMKNSNNTSGGVSYIPLCQSNAAPNQLINNSKPNEIWTAIAIDSVTKHLWLANSFKYTTAGVLYVYDLQNMTLPTRDYSTGIIPNTIRFYHNAH